MKKFFPTNEVNQTNNNKEEKTSNVNDLLWGLDSSVQGSGSVKSINNVIYYYASVSHQSILDLTEQIVLVTRNMKVLAIENNISPPPITLHIGSYGGSVLAGFAGMDLIQNNSVPIYTIIDGAAASAATLLSVVGLKRSMYKNAYMLIHQLSTFCWGKFEELKDELSNMEKLMETIRNTYLVKTKLTRDKLTEMLKHDWWLNAEECYEFGLVDQII